MLQDVLFGAKRRFDEKFAAKAPVTHRGDPAGAEVVAIHVGPGRVVSVHASAWQPGMRPTACSWRRCCFQKRSSIRQSPGYSRVLREGKGMPAVLAQETRPRVTESIVSTPSGRTLALPVFLQCLSGILLRASNT